MLSASVGPFRCGILRTHSGWFIAWDRFVGVPPHRSRVITHITLIFQPQPQHALPSPFGGLDTREATRQINRQLATASDAFANGIWLPGKGYINTVRNKRRAQPDPKGAVVGDEDGVVSSNECVRKSNTFVTRLPVWLSVYHAQQTGRRQTRQMERGVPYNGYRNGNGNENEDWDSV